MRTYDTVAVQVGLQLALAPRVESTLLGRLGSLGEVAGSRGVRAAASAGRRRVGGLSGRDKIITASSTAVANLLCGSVATVGEVALEAVVGEVVPSPSAVGVSRLVSVSAHQSLELSSLGALGDGDTAGVEVRLETGVRPVSNDAAERFLGGEGGVISGLGVLVAGFAGSSTEGTGSRCGYVVAEDLGTVLADKSTELIRLGALGN